MPAPIPLPLRQRLWQLAQQGLATDLVAARLHLPRRTVQPLLRQAFGRWGLPGGLRVDNGKPWGSWSDLPTALALWLLGLGIELHWNPPRQPQRNGVVERSQGTGKRW